ncbi:tRNA (guanine(37)-N1)-methyltransferase [Culicoides brevitarsis]|uniref:tRNA (guanine(37)-N1)-methyltransferase n=1 Tax=Culicoides brevitarsis TaxID=469753 RepID=UPI00307C5EB2
MHFIFSRALFIFQKNFAEIPKRFRYVYKNMDILQPPHCIRGMTELQKDLFTKDIKVPVLVLENQSTINGVMPLIKSKLLKMANMKAVLDHQDKKVVLLHPESVKSFEDLPTTQLESKGVNSEHFIQNFDLKISYANWSANELLKQILPEDKEGMTSFSRIGHIIHLNLKEHLLPYKKIIAEILMDKMSGIRAVVNKAQTIDNVYRNFSMELLKGEADYQVTVKENGIEFEFDFSSVYWNPRLSSEHDRIVKLIKPNDVLYDVFAGVGPFAVPVAKKGIQVYANDLNPESYKWLNHNATKNKCKKHMETFNKDGREFLLNDARSNLLQRLKDPDFQGVPHFVMNLPAMAVEFLDVFRGYLKSEKPFPIKNLPVVHVYCFAKGIEDKEKIALDLVHQHLGMELPKNSFIKCNFVRNVAPNKDMMRVDFYLTPEILFSSDDVIEPPLKKSKFDQNGQTLEETGETTGSQTSSVGKTEKGNESL